VNEVEVVVVNVYLRWRGERQTDRQRDEKWERSAAPRLELVS